MQGTMEIDGEKGQSDGSKAVIEQSKKGAQSAFLLPSITELYRDLREFLTNPKPQ